jgi:hypothetical protein
MAKKAAANKEVEQKEVQTTVGLSELASALVQAIQATQPPRKETAANRKPKTPWTPKDGSPKLKLKRKMHQHGMPIDADILTNEQIALINQLKPGTYMNGNVRVVRRRDKGLDIDYPIKTAAQRLKLVNQFGITSFDSLIQRCLDEAADPIKYAQPEDLD